MSRLRCEQGGKRLKIHRRHSDSQDPCVRHVVWIIIELHTLLTITNPFWTRVWGWYRIDLNMFSCDNKTIIFSP